ncbi:hypothetical protein [Pseudonocardia sp. NPDC049635]|uniref:glucuronyl esterase domain-containing protein n=1 Tax=Pseudonocardia sp. NPDC049635 TaxID=3155506 RepID=UPI0033F2595F
MKQILDLRSVHHRVEDRIRAHVLLCWLALLLARIVETRTNTPDTATTWPRARDPVQRLHVGTFTGPAGLFRQTTPQPRGPPAAPGPRHRHGESIAAINDQFPHWFPDTYADYAGDADQLPVDQHQLLALIAPGRVVIGSATDDATAVPRGEYASYLAAAPVYELYGLAGTGLPTTTSWPPPTDQAHRGPGMSYHLRTGGHGLQPADWDIYLTSDLFHR